jgi:hypothetical protein
MNVDQHQRSDLSESKTEEKGSVPRSPPSHKTKEKDLPKSVREGRLSNVNESCSRAFTCEWQYSHCFLVSLLQWTSGDGGHGRASGGAPKEAKRKDQSKQRNSARLYKMEAQNSDLDSGHLEIDHGTLPPAMSTDDSLSRESESSCDCSAPLVYGKSLHSPHSGALLAKGSSSLIFPTGVEAPFDVVVPANDSKRRRINLILDQCESVRFPFKKKLILANLDLAASDIPLKDLVNTSLGNSLYKLSLAGNRLAAIPPDLVQCLPFLNHLDLSQCELHQLPDQWNLPKLKRLNLSHNRISDFPDKVRFNNVGLFLNVVSSPTHQSPLHL